MADFSDLKEPEMTKRRPVIVISPKLPYRSQLVTIVPISLTEPRHHLPFCYRLSKNYHPKADDQVPSWAKCDMVMNIALRRLDAFRIGRRNYAYPSLTPDDLKGVRHGVLYGLGMTHLIDRAHSLR